MRVEAIPKMSFGSISALDPGFKSSTYWSMHPKGTSFGRLRVETWIRLDLSQIPCFLRGTKILSLR